MKNERIIVEIIVIMAGEDIYIDKTIEAILRLASSLVSKLIASSITNFMKYSKALYPINKEMTPIIIFLKII